MLTFYPNLLFYKAPLGNTIYKVKACGVTDGVFKLFEVVVLATFHDKYSQ